jgi:uncharacterized protein YPO0396
MSRTVTVSKALRLSKQLRGQLASLHAKLPQVLNWEEGQEPKVKFHDILNELRQKASQLAALKAAIARSNANSQVKFENRDICVQEAIDIMAELKSQKALLGAMKPHWSEDIQFQQAIIEAGEKQGQLGYRQVKRVFKSALTDEEQQKLLTELQERIDALNDVLEHHNHGATIALAFGE